MDRIYQVSLTVPFGTSSLAAATLAVPLENAFLASIELLIPPGPSGFTGIRVRSSRQQIIPWGNTEWIIADNYRNTFPVNEEVGSKSISVQAYNTDVYDHTFYLRFQVRDIGPGQSQSSLNSAGVISNLILSGFTNDTGLPPPGGIIPPSLTSPLPQPPPPPIPVLPPLPP